MMFRWLIAFILTLLMFRASAQTTQPAKDSPSTPPPAAWSEAVDRLANCLTQQSSDGHSQISADSAIRSFDGSTRVISDVTAYTGGATLLMAKAYSCPANTIADDIGSCISSATVSGEIKRLLMPAEGDTRANSTAEKWVRDALNLAAGENFAVLVYFTGDVTHADSPEGQILFVLLKARKDAAGAYSASQIVFGDGQQASNASASAR
jgi:hypothetical protein